MKKTMKFWDRIWCDRGAMRFYSAWSAVCAGLVLGVVEYLPWWPVALTEAMAAYCYWSFSTRYEELLKGPGPEAVVQRTTVFQGADCSYLLQVDCRKFHLGDEVELRLVPRRGR